MKAHLFQSESPIPASTVDLVANCGELIKDPAYLIIVDDVSRGEWEKADVRKFLTIRNVCPKCIQEGWQFRYLYFISNRRGQVDAEALEQCHPSI